MRDDQQPSISPCTIWRMADQHLTQTQDLLAAEEPMELRLGYMWRGKRASQSVSITMRTPGHDFELATGFLLTEGMIHSADQVQSVDFCGEPTPEGLFNVVRVDLHDEVKVDLGRLKRHFYTSSSCGVCGKASLEALAMTKTPELLAQAPRIPATTLMILPAALRQAQDTFSMTGGLHACGLFDSSGHLLLVREDVGRHNALDKLIGASLMSGALPLHDRVLVLSGRASFELVQKAIMAGISLIAAVGAPSSLAVSLAKRYDITLVGFLSAKRFNIYHAPHRIITPEESTP